MVKWSEILGYDAEGRRFELLFGQWQLGNALCQLDSCKIQ